MNAHALLTSQGWRGSGHSLHPTNDNTGLSKPLLVSRKDNTLGVGKKQHKTSDMWWMNAFDSSLKGLDTSKEGVVVQTMTSGGLDMIARGGGKYVGKGGLYSSFVRGECLSGTLTPEEREEIEKTNRTITETAKKRKRGEVVESQEDRRARKAAKRAAKEAAHAPAELLQAETVVAHTAVKKEETKEERRSRKALRHAVNAEEDMSVKEPITPSPEMSTSEHETKVDRRARKAAKKETKALDLLRKSLEETTVEVAETKDERKERKRLEKFTREAVKAKPEESMAEVKRKKRRKE